MEEAIATVLEYQERASRLFENGTKLVRRGELEKAGEFFWGAIASYVNALRFIYQGKASSGHKEMVLAAKEMAMQANDSKLFQAIETSEKFHANYYHGFISKDEFSKYYEEAKYAFDSFHSILERERVKRGIGIENASKSSGLQPGDVQ
jgi:hypothetical protein